VAKNVGAVVAFVLTFVSSAWSQSPTVPPPKPKGTAANEVDPFGTPGAPTIENPAAECPRLSADWFARVDASEKRAFTAVLFDRAGKVCALRRDFVVAADPIYTGMVDDGGLGAATVTFTGCGAEAPLSVFGDAIPKGLQEQSGKFTVRQFPERVCHGDADLTLTLEAVRLDGPIKGSITLHTYPRYRASLQIGVVSSQFHDQSFALRKDGDVNRVFGKETSDRGPEYLGSVVLYGVPQYLFRPSGHGFYPGRDIVHDHGVLDRAGLVLSTSLTHPSQRFGVGFAYELLPGVSATVAYHRVRTTELVGLKEGDAFAGTAEQIPTRNLWTSEWTGGISLDLLLATRLLTRK
jgi:hypothetical protein